MERSFCRALGQQHLYGHSPPSGVHEHMNPECIRHVRLVVNLVCDTAFFVRVRGDRMSLAVLGV